MVAISIALYLAASLFHCQAADAGGRVASVEFLDDQVVLIPAQVFGQTVQLIADTGATLSYLDRSLKDRLGPPVERGTEVSVFGSKPGAVAYSGQPILVGGLRLVPKLLGCQDFAVLSMVSGLRCDGILGMNVLANYVVCLDFDQRRFSLTGKVPEPVRRRALAIPLNEGPNGYTIQASVNGIPIRLAIDSGSTDFLDLAPDDWEKVLARAEQRNREWGAVADGRGEVRPVAATRIQAVNVGTSTYTNVVARRSTDTNGPSLLGVEFLRQHTTTIDFPGHTVYLLPGRRFGEAVAYDKSGLHLIKLLEDGAIVVHSVSAGSPAALSGFRAGDRLVTLNAKPAQALGLKGIREMLREKDGAEITVEVSRTGETMKFSFKLRTML
jgi:predicted aspartyl protease